MYNKTKDYALIWKALSKEQFIPLYSEVYDYRVGWLKRDLIGCTICIPLNNEIKTFYCVDLPNFYAQCLQLGIEFIKP